MQTVELKHAHRLLKHGPTVLVGSQHAGRHFYAIGEPVKALPVANA
jgi:hypothetical protein